MFTFILTTKSNLRKNK